jgi:hypothetical protein
MPTFPSSTAIARVEYDPATRRLRVWFRETSKEYTYVGVPVSVYEGLLRAPSKGSYFEAFIRDRYGFV